MKFRRTPRFFRDYRGLGENEKSAIHEAFPEVSDALLGNSELFSKYRIKKMSGWPDIWEGHVKINLCFTFHYEYENREKICFFRRVGTHEIYDSP